MELLLFLTAFLFTLQEDRKAPPDEKTRTELAKEIEGLDWFPKAGGGRLQTVGNALEIGQRAEKETDDDRAWVKYRLAMKLADAAGENRISHDFAHAIASRWNVPDDFLVDWYEDAVERTRNQARIPELAILMAEDMKRLGAAPKTYAKETVTKWEQAFSEVRGLASEAANEQTKEACALAFERTKGWLSIARESESNEARAFRLILTGDVPAGIKRLAGSSNSKLADVATRVAQSETPFSKDHQQLLEILARSQNKAANFAGQKIFESMLPELTKDQIRTCQPICYFMTEDLPLRDDFSLPYYGRVRNGYHPYTKDSKVPEGYTFDEGRWSIEGSGSLPWPSLPFENYVQETHVTVEKIESTVNLEFGVEDSAEVRFKRDGDNYFARLIRRVASRNTWDGTLKLKYDQPLVVRVYRTPKRMWAFIELTDELEKVNEVQLKPRTYGLAWHKFRLTGGTGSKFSISKIKTRPWLPGDREVLSELAGKHKSIEMTAQRFNSPSQQDYQKYLQGLKDVGTRRVENESFVTPFEIVMRPVAAGKFERPVDKRKVSISKDFYCSAHEITQSQFSEIMGYNPASTQGNPYLPVDSVSFDEAMKFCKLLNERLGADGDVPEGYVYRLPTEAEWTWAAMADGKSNMDVPEAECWHWDTSAGGYHMVGTSTPSKRGLYDMHGNVEELTFTKFWKRKSPEDTTETEKLVDPFEVPTYGRGQHIVIKGGSWNVSPDWTHASWRGRRAHAATPGRGFRVVLAPELN